jgi:cell pole-organizing protein PopZ
MEEILASIRRIISDDQPPGGEAKAPPPADEPVITRSELSVAVPANLKSVPIEDDILDLEDDDPVQLDAAPPVSEIMFEEAAPAPPAPPPPQFNPPEPRPAPPRDDALLSRQTDEAVGQAFQTLAGSILAGSQRTLDDIVKEMLRPMLKVWLDDNLPGIVERLVRAEIERVARGGR